MTCEVARLRLVSTERDGYVANTLRVLSAHLSVGVVNASWFAQPALRRMEAAAGVRRFFELGDSEALRGRETARSSRRSETATLPTRSAVLSADLSIGAANAS